jgi:hypothetical protein
MAGTSHTAKIDLRFGDPAGEFLDVRIGLGAGNFTREGLNVFG